MEISIQNAKQESSKISIIIPKPRSRITISRFQHQPKIQCIDQETLKENKEKKIVKYSNAIQKRSYVQFVIPNQSENLRSITEDQSSKSSKLNQNNLNLSQMKKNSNLCKILYSPSFPKKMLQTESLEINNLKNKVCLPRQEDGKINRNFFKDFRKPEWIKKDNLEKLIWSQINQSTIDYSNQKWVNIKLSNLKQFLNTLFSYKEILVSDITCMSPDEFNICQRIFSSRKYDNICPLISNLQRKTWNVEAWKNFYKIKRKEEHLKCAFKFLIKNLKFRFKRKNKDFLGSEKLDFYWFYFGQLEYKQKNPGSIKKLKNGRIKEKLLWSKLEKYIIPGLGGKPENKQYKTINKGFLRVISKSRKFISELFELNLDLVLYMGYFWNVDWRLVGHEQRDQMDLRGFQILTEVGMDNRNEISKLFSTWENLINKNDKDNSLDKKLEIIIQSICNTKLSFAWSYKEIHDAFIFTCLSIVECIKFDFLPEEAQSI